MNRPPEHPVKSPMDFIELRRTFRMVCDSRVVGLLGVRENDAAPGLCPRPAP